jgi:hypothetical protein
MAANQTRQRMAMLVRQWETTDEPRRAFAPVHVIDAHPQARASACVEVLLRDGDHLVIHEGASVDLARPPHGAGDPPILRTQDAAITNAWSVRLSTGAHGGGTEDCPYEVP